MAKVDGVNRITAGQARRLERIARLAGWTDAELRMFLARRGADSSELVSGWDYTDLCAELRKGPIRLGDKKRKKGCDANRSPER